MLAFGRVVAAFVVMVAIGYIAMVIFLPAPNIQAVADETAAGRSAAAQLTEQAQALVAHKPVGALQ